MLAAVRSCIVVALLAAAVGCSTNPVTGEKELVLTSEASEIQIGEQNFAPSRQSQGGAYVLLPDLTSYVNEVGQKLAAVSDRQLPYEFAVLNSSVPNAWALPGGKIAVNRGLLTTLENEAELAAVLGHEIVHAAARHGVKAQERGTFFEVGMVAAQIGLATSDSNSQLGDLGLMAAGLGAQAFMMKYGREAELESDEHGMKYMDKAGYDPSAAVTLQQKFLALSRGKGSASQNWLEGLFASHPPSAERVERNRAHLAVFGTGGDLGVSRYKARLAPLMAIKPAYDKADDALAAATKKEFGRAKALASEAVQRLPREASFHQLQGDIAMAEQQPQRALPHYEKSIRLNPNYFGPHLGGGLALYKLGDKQRAEQWLARSADMLPTAPAMYYRGMIAKERGDTERAWQFFKQATDTRGELGQRAKLEFTLLDLSRNPDNYVAAELKLDQRGHVVVAVRNRSMVALSSITVTPMRTDAVVGAVEARSIRVLRVLRPGERAVLDAGIGVVPPQVLKEQFRVRVDGARAAR